MRVLLINAVCGTGSTGKICGELADAYSADGHEVKIAYGRYGYVPAQFEKYAVRIGTDLDVRLHAVYTRLTDQHGFGSTAPTRRFLKWASEYNPDVLWLHNLHGYYINIELLFRWIKSRPNMQVKWTLHDCWAFTGHCSHFSFVGCDQWKTECKVCVQKERYPACIRSNCKNNYQRKKNAFTGVKNMTIYTPSQWLKDLVEQSFLKEYPVEVLPNKANTEVFRPTPGDFRQRYGIEGKFVVLGVANVWDDRKGLQDFLRLADILGNTYQIVLVGVNQQQIKDLPSSILGIARTNSQKELAEIYTTADVHMVPSKEETFGMTILEAHLCGTRSVVLKGTACEEVALPLNGMVVADDVHEMARAIMELVSQS